MERERGGRGGDAPRDAAVRWLAARGATVRFFAEADNCVRPRDGEEGDAAPFLIEVQGTPNLFHELAHIVLLGRIAKDHATEHSRIPFQLEQEHGRRLFAEELACCIASCAWHPGSDTDARAWLDEQVGIQPCFFGMEGELPRFLAACERALATDRAGFAAICARALAEIGVALRAGGLPEGAATPPRRFEPFTEWRALLLRNGVAPTG